MTRATVPLALIAAFSLQAAPAIAQDPAYPARMLTIAYHTMPGPCNTTNPVTIQWQPIPGGYIGAADPGLNVDPVTGEWTFRSCTIELDPAWWATATDVDRCKIITHEVGHLGLRHHTPTGVMAFDMGGDYAPCDVFRTLDEATDAALMELAATHPGWTVGCDMARGRMVPCEATRHRRLVRYRVKVRGGLYMIRRVHPRVAHV
jgi:hypothetical protein